MLQNQHNHHGPPIFQGGPFFFLLFIVSSFAAAQQDSIVSYYLNAGASYTDIFRQSSDRSQTTVFTKDAHLLLGAVSDNDSLYLQFRTDGRYAAVNQQESRFTGSLHLGRRTFTVGTVGTYSILRYALSAGVPVDESRRTVHYGISFSIAPFGSLLSASISHSTAPLRYSAGFTFLDFLVPANEEINGETSGYSITLAPLPSLTARIEYLESLGERNAGSGAYSSSTRYRSIINRFSGTYAFSEDVTIRAGTSIGEYRLDLDLNKEGLSFGGLDNGVSHYIRYSAGATLPAIQLSSEYYFEQFDLSGLGGIESWPFTTLAASIITNRLNYTFSGMVKHHALTNEMTGKFTGLMLTGTLSYHRILTDAVLEHWEPEFLVFGRKNFTADPFIISDLHLLGLSLTTVIPCYGVDISLFAEQYLPFSIRYRAAAGSTGQAPSPSTSVSSRSVSDGGRRGGISVSIPI